MYSIFLSKGIDYLSKIVSESNSLRDIMKHFSYTCGGDSYTLLKKILAENEIDYSHFKISNFTINEKKPIEFYLTKNSKMTSNRLKLKLFKSDILKEKCSECGIGNYYNNKPISLQLDHINGVNNDNRLENLRILCPNCHSQTDTYAGKLKKNRCSSCLCIISNDSTKCRKCNNSEKSNNEIFEIQKEELEKLIWTKTMVEIASDYGCSDKTIAKKIKKYNLEKPPRGYFISKKNHQNVS